MKMEFRMNRAVALASAFAMSVALTGCKTTDLTSAMNDMGFPAPSESQNDSTGKKVAGGGLACAGAGLLGYLGTKSLASSLKADGMTGAQVENAAIMVAGLGCVVGAAVAVKLVENMDEKTKQAEEDAWATVQAETKTEPTSAPRVWTGSGDSKVSGGEISIIEPETIDGQECATRKNYYNTSEGNVETFSRVCRNEDGVYEVVEA